MKELLKKMTVMVREGSKKVVATVLMALTFLSPLSGVACAAPKGGYHKPPHQVVHMTKHSGGHMHRAPAHHPAPRHEVHYSHYRGHHHDDGAAIVGGLILGAIIGAAINNAND